MKFRLHMKKFGAALAVTTLLAGGIAFSNPNPAAALSPPSGLSPFVTCDAAKYNGKKSGTVKCYTTVKVSLRLAVRCGTGPIMPAASKFTSWTTLNAHKSTTLSFTAGKYCQGFGQVWRIDPKSK